jgi:hypothetical protein
MYEEPPQLELGTMRCSSCEREWIEVLPPLCLGLDFWPECCGRLAVLVEALRAVVLT